MNKYDVWLVAIITLAFVAVMTLIALPTILKEAHAGQCVEVKHE